MENNDLIIGLDHISLGVSSLSESIQFYTNILGFKQIDRPDFKFNGAWLSLGKGFTLHLIENKEIEIHFSNSRAFHFALHVQDISKLKTYLQENGIEIIKDIKLRPDGVKQMFIKDPDGYYIEFSEI